MNAKTDARQRIETLQSTTRAQVCRWIAAIMVPQFLGLCGLAYAFMLLPDQIALQDAPPQFWGILIAGTLVTSAAAFIALAWPYRPWAPYAILLMQATLSYEIFSMPIQVGITPLILTVALAALFRTRHLLFAGGVIAATVVLAFGFAEWVINSSGVLIWDSLIQTCWIGLVVAALLPICRYWEDSMMKILSLEDSLAVANRKASNLILAEREENQRNVQRKSAVVNNALDGIISLDSKGRITEFNPAAEAIFGLGRHDVIGQPFLKFLPKRYWELVVESLRAARGGDRHGLLNARTELMALDATGEEIPIELTLTADDINDWSMLTAFVRNMREQKQLETKLAHAQKMESIGQLAAGVAHEINTPNQYIGDNIEFLRDSLSTVRDAALKMKEGLDPTQMEKLWQEADLDYLLEETPKAVDHALEGVSRVGQIVKAMKDFSHPGTREKTESSINEIIMSTTTITRNEWKYHAKLELDLDPMIPNTLVHPGEIGQVVLNLIINSAHAIRDHRKSHEGLIKIRTFQREGSIVIEVSDNGCGIPEKHRDRVFDPFFTTKGVGIGTGQGLAITHSVIVQHHQGDISLDTKDGEGTTIRITLPIKFAPQEAIAA